MYIGPDGCLLPGYPSGRTDVGRGTGDRGMGGAGSQKWAGAGLGDPCVVHPVGMHRFVTVTVLVKTRRGEITDTKNARKEAKQ